MSPIYSRTWYWWGIWRAAITIFIGQLPKLFGFSTDADTTAVEMPANLDLELNAAGIHLVFTELKNPAQNKFVRYGLLETIDRRHFSPTIKVAVEDFYREFQPGQM